MKFLHSSTRGTQNKVINKTLQIYARKIVPTCQRTLNPVYCCQVCDEFDGRVSEEIISFLCPVSMASDG